MNKYLMITAAALLSSTATVDAGSYCFAFGTGGGSYPCTIYELSTGVDGGTFGKAARALIATNESCTGATNQGYGLLSKVRGLGNVSLMSDDVLAKMYGIYSTAISYALPKQIKNGQPMSLWVGMDGVTFYEALSGYLIRVGVCQVPSTNHSHRSALDVVKAIIAAHRNARSHPE